MKKLLLLLAVLCGTVSGWAQGQTVTSITSGKWYQLKCTATDGVHGNGTTVWLSDNGSAFAGKSAIPTSFQFIATGNGKYHILSYKSNKYLGASGTSVVQEETATTEWTVGTINNEGYVYISSSDKNYLNNAGGTNNIQIKNHSSGVSSGNPCSLWYLTEEPESKYPFTVSSESEKYYYAIKSGRDTDGKTWWYTYTPSDGKIQLTQFVASDDQLWYFMEVTEAENTYIRLFPKNGNGMAMSYENNNGGANKIVAKPIGTDGWTNTWEFVKSGGFAPYGLKTPTATMYLSNHSGVSHKMGMHSAAPINDAGTAMYIMTSAEARNEVVKPEVLTNAKNTAKAELDGLHSVPAIYPTDPAEYKTRIEAVSILAEGTDAEIIDSYLKSVPAVQSIVTEYRNVAYQGLEGKYYTFNTPDPDRSDKGYIRINNDVVIGVQNADSPIDLWKFIHKENAVLVYNQFLKKYLCEPAGNSSRVAVTSEQSQAGRYHLNVNTNAANEAAKIKLTSNGKSVHMDGNGYLVRWDNGGASEWTVTPCDESFLAQTVENYKNSAVSSLDLWAKLPKVFDTERIAEVKTAIEGLTDADEIDNQVRSLFVSGENEDNIRLLAWNHGDDGRDGEYLSVDKSTNKAYGTKDMSFDAIWSLRYLGNCKFAFYNMFNQKYLGTPSANAPMQQTPVAMYFELQNAEDAKVIIKTSANEVMHLSNWQANANNGTPLHAIQNAGAQWNASWWDLEFEDNFETFEAEALDLIEEYNNKYFNNVPVGLETITGDAKETYDNAVTSFNEVLSAGTDLYVLTNLACYLKEVVETLPKTVQAPKIGKFYRLKNQRSGKYMSGNGSTIKLNGDGNANEVLSTIFYLDENNVWLSYADGRYMDTYERDYSAVGTANAGEFGLASGGAQENVITYKNRDHWTYGGADSGQGPDNIDRGTSAPNDGYNWIIENVSWLPVPMNTTAGYATLYSPVALSTYESGSTTEHRVEAYVGTINNNYFSMERIDAEDGIIPANTPVVLKYVNGYDEAKKAVYLEIKESDKTYDLENDLEGTVADTYISTPSYVLSMQEGVVGFYKAMMNQQDGASFLNNGFRAYLPAGDNNARSLVFDFGGTETGIDELKGENGNVKAEVYDLAGRRVLNAKKGVFVVNGKVIVK